MGLTNDVYLFSLVSYDVWGDGDQELLIAVTYQLYLSVQSGQLHSCDLPMMFICSVWSAMMSGEMVTSSTS